MLSQLDAFGRSVVGDPLDKSPLNFDSDFAYANYGRRYPIRDGILDCRLLPTRTTHEQRVWLEGQVEFEQWNAAVWLDQAQEVHQAERDALAHVYADFDFSNKRVIDVGGSCGLLRHFLPIGAPYLVVDPHQNVLAQVQGRQGLLATYPFLRDPLNFVCADAEFLPIQSSTFDVVHMRSCIDHFLNPELALSEGYRVLDGSGTLIVGTSLEDGHTRASVATRARNLAAKLAGRAEHDHHTWHPTMQSVQTLIEDAGFRVDERVLQDGFDGRVIYLYCSKVSGATNPRTA